MVGLRSDRDAGLSERGLECRDRTAAIVEDAGAGDGVEAVLLHGLDDMLRPAGAAAADDGNADLVAHGAKQRTIETLAGAFHVDGSDEDFTRAEPFGLGDPRHHIDAGALTAVVG